MTTENGSEKGTTRRGFLAGCGAAVAGAAVTGAIVQTALPWGTERVAGASAPKDAAEAYRAAWRAAYLECLEELAESMRPGFQAGEYYSFRDRDPEGQRRAEDACGRHFGLGTQDEWEEGVGTGTARMILVASPHTEATGYGADYPCDHAREAVAWDVIVIARERGWYVPTEDECEEPGVES